MKVLLNGLLLNEHNTGVQNYTRNLYNELKKSDSDGVKISLIKKPTQNRINRILYENLSLPGYLLKNKFDIYHSTNYVLPYKIKSLSVLTVHDLITLNYPELCQRESVLYFKIFLGRSILRADRIIAVSDTVKEDILKRFRIEDEKIDVIHHGVEEIFRKKCNTKILHQYNLPDKYILFVGNIEPKKNLTRLICAFDLLRKYTDLKQKLVIAGRKGWKYNSVFQMVNKLKINNEVIFMDYIPQHDLPFIYSMADLFVFPSLYEGFGIPPLEAMACEVPVIVSDKGALPEITGGKCTQVDPYNINEMARAMYRLLTDDNMKKHSVLEGKNWVKQFTWENTAAKTMEIFRRTYCHQSETANSF